MRLPRRALGARLVEHEQRWLPTLAARLPVRVPVPVFAGCAGQGYPWAWSVTPWFEGSPAAEHVGSLSPATRSQLVRRLVEVLEALHVPAPTRQTHPDLPDADLAPENPYRGGPLQERREIVTARIDDVNYRRAWLEWSRAAPWDGPAVWIHGDLHPLNVLLHGIGHTEGQQLSAIIDFGDLTAGDPAYDLAIAWLLLDRVGRSQFRRGLDRGSGVTSNRLLGPAGSDALWLRAKAFALDLATIFAATSRPGSPEERIADFGLRQIFDA